MTVDIQLARKYTLVAISDRAEKSTLVTPAVNNSAVAVPLYRKAERSQSLILGCAEELFATRSYSTTRLEDVADAGGMGRAALFYYFRDKQCLYDAMIQNAFASLAAQLDKILTDSECTIAYRIEQAVVACVDSIVARPALARLILRYVADATELPTRSMSPDFDRILLRFLVLFRSGLQKRRTQTAARRSIPRCQYRHRNHRVLRVSAGPFGAAWGIRTFESRAGSSSQAGDAVRNAAAARYR